MIDWPSIPIWLRITHRDEIDKRYRPNNYGMSIPPLSDKEVRAIRRSDVSAERLAVKYKVNRGTIERIKSGKQYKDVEDT
jgi:hypothetical protein